MKNRLVIVTFPILILTSAQFVMAQQCVDLFSKIKVPNLEKIEDSEKLMKIYDRVSVLLQSTGFTEALFGQKKPSWNEYNSLLEIQKIIQGSDSVKRIKYLNPTERILLRVRLNGVTEVTKAHIEKNVTVSQFKEFLDSHFAWFKLIESINKDVQMKNLSKTQKE